MTTDASYFTDAKIPLNLASDKASSVLFLFKTTTVKEEGSSLAATQRVICAIVGRLPKPSCRLVFETIVMRNVMLQVPPC
jgi:hypothetical protein